jgi:hypothetical protein
MASWQTKENIRGLAVATVAWGIALIWVFVLL